MKNKNLVKNTTSRSEFNRAYKIHLEQRGGIHCSYCKYHHGENDDRKWYGKWSINKDIKYPNWKLVSKNQKQWQKKPIKIITEYNIRRDYEYIEFKF